VPGVTPATRGNDGLTLVRAFDLFGGGASILFRRRYSTDKAVAMRECGASVSSQKLALDAADLELQAVVNDALFDVRVRFYTVLVNREKIKVQEQNVELLKRQLQDVKNRFDAGTVSNFEVLR